MEKAGSKTSLARVLGEPERSQPIKIGSMHVHVRRAVEAGQWKAELRVLLGDGRELEVLLTEADFEELKHKIAEYT